MRIFTAGLMTETNSFSAVPTSRRSFDNAFSYRAPTRSLVPEPAAYDLIGCGTFLRKAREKGYSAVLSSYEFAEPGAPSRRMDYEALRDDILDDLRRAMPVDMALLVLHGAQMAQGIDDCEGDILARVREIVGPTCFIGVLLDLHGNTSQAMLSTANALVAGRLYPHTDYDVRAEQLFDIGERHVLGQIRTAHYFHRVPMLGMYYTTLAKMTALNQQADRVEAIDGVHSVSLMHGFPWADQPDTGAGIIVVAEPDRQDVPALARDLAHRFFDARNETRDLSRPIDEILDEIDASGAGGPFVVADIADNPGGGAGSDSTFILRRLIERGAQDAVLGMVWDPIAVDFSFDAGQGNQLNLRLGGKTGPFAGAPLDVSATVLQVKEDVFQLDPAGGPRLPIGRSALLQVGGIRVLVNSLRQQVYGTKVFTDFGIHLAAQRLIVVKSTQHFHTAYAPIAKKIFYCDTPGSLTQRFEAGFYRRLDGAIWPLDPEARPA
jgi:microcystin degradation protein MlrC